MNYYYTVASLPLLFYDRDLPVNRDTFLEMCRRELTPEDTRVLDSAVIHHPDRGGPSCGLLNGWRRWETSLRNELVKVRAHRKGWDADKHIRESDEAPGTAETARDGFGQSSPLAGEDTLDRARWAAVDELETGHHFDLEKLVAYYLKLQILERKTQFKNEVGSEKLETCLEPEK